MIETVKAVFRNIFHVLKIHELGLVVHACNPSAQEAEAEGRVKVRVRASY